MKTWVEENLGCGGTIAKNQEPVPTWRWQTQSDSGNRDQEQTAEQWFWNRWPGNRRRANFGIAWGQRNTRSGMAGLLAWAADVVGGSGAGSDDHTLRMTPQQWQAVSALDARAAALQHSLQQIRQRMPPAHIAERLPHLHADSVAAHSALALEIHAHSATREQVCKGFFTLEVYKGLLATVSYYASLFGSCNCGRPFCKQRMQHMLKRWRPDRSIYVRRLRKVVTWKAACRFCCTSSLSLGLCGNTCSIDMFLQTPIQIAWMQDSFFLFAYFIAFEFFLLNDIWHQRDCTPESVPAYLSLFFLKIVLLTITAGDGA